MVLRLDQVLRFLGLAILPVLVNLTTDVMVVVMAGSEMELMEFVVEVILFN